MSKVIRVTSISDEALKRLKAKGFTVMITGSKNTGELAALQRQATKALKHGDTAKAKSARLSMLKLIQGGRDDAK